jgi:hypothetical protein
MASHHYEIPILLALSLSGLCSCNRDVPAPTAVVETTSIATQSVAIAPVAETFWYQCADYKATKALVTEVTMPSVFKRARSEIFLRADVRTNEQEELARHFPKPITMACGSGGSFHEGVSLDNRHYDADHVTIDFYYFWTFVDSKQSGGIEEKLVVKVGESKRHHFARGAFVDVSWRDVEPDPGWLKLKNQK